MLPFMTAACSQGKGRAGPPHLGFMQNTGTHPPQPTGAATHHQNLAAKTWHPSAKAWHVYTQPASQYTPMEPRFRGGFRKTRKHRGSVIKNGIPVPGGVVVPSKKGTPFPGGFRHQKRNPHGSRVPGTHNACMGSERQWPWHGYGGFPKGVL